MMRQSVWVWIGGCLWTSVFAVHTPITLTADQAVMMALRSSPQAKNIQWTKQLNHNTYTTTFNHYRPTWRLQAQYSKPRLLPKTYDAGVAMHQDFLSGGHLDVSWQPKTSQGHLAQLSATQPILRGFGMGHLTLDNARDSYVQQQLAVYNSLNDLVASTLQAYWAVIQAKQNYQVQQLGFRQVQQTYKRYQIKVNAGQQARASLMEQKGQLLRYELGLETQKNNIQATIKTLLLQLGLSEQSRIELDSDLHVKDFYHLPPIATCLRIAKKHNAEIRTARLGVNIAKRQRQLAKDALRPQLDVSASTDQNHDQTMGVQWSLPLDNQDLQSAFVAADVAYQQARQSLDNALRNNRKDIINTWHTLQSEQAQIAMQEQTLSFSQKNYDLTVKKNQYGMASSLDMTIKQQAVTTDQQSLINLKIAYLTDYIKFLRLQGRLLAHWHLTYQGGY